MSAWTERGRVPATLERDRRLVSWLESIATEAQGFADEARDVGDMSGAQRWSRTAMELRRAAQQARKALP